MDYSVGQLLRFLTVSLDNTEQKFEEKDCKGPEGKQKSAILMGCRLQRSE